MELFISSESDTSINAMARLKRDEVLKQRISEATGMPIGDINAQNSRCFENYRYFDDQ